MRWHQLYTLLFYVSFPFPALLAGENLPKSSGQPNRRLKVLINNPAIGWSHMQYQGRLADLLTDAGHEVHLLTQEMNPLLANYTGVSRGQRVRRYPRPSDRTAIS